MATTNPRHADAAPARLRHPAPTPNPPIPARYAPDLVRVLAGTITVLGRAAVMADQPRKPFLAALQRRVETDDGLCIRDVVVLAACDVLHAVGVLPTAPGAAGPTADPAVVADLEQAWQAADAPVGPHPPTLAGYIDAATRSGWAAERVVDQLIRHEAGRHIGLIRMQVGRMADRFPGYTTADLLGWGWDGMRLALRRYDPTRGALSTYAVPRIRGSIQDGVRAEQVIPKRAQTRLRKVADAEESLTHQLHRTPTLTELAEVLDEQLPRLQTLLRLRHPARLDDTDSDDTAPSPDLVDTDHDPADLAAAGLLADAVADAIATLDPADADAVWMTVCDRIPATVVAARLGMTPRAVRERSSQALVTLADLLADWAPAAA